MIKYLVLLLAFLSISLPAAAQTPTCAAVQQSGSVTNGHGVQWIGKCQIADTGASALGVASINSNTGAFTFVGSAVSCTGTTCTFSGGGNPGGSTNSLQYQINGTTFGGITPLTTGQILVGAASGPGAPQTVSGDATLGSTGVLTLGTVNTNVGTFQGLTVNGKGQVTAASNQNYLTAPVANGSLANSAITFGATSQALGSTVTNLNAVNLGPSTAGTGAFTTLSANSTVTLSGISGSMQCLHVNSSGVVTGTGSDCGSGSGGVTSFSGDGTILSNSSSTGAVTATLASAGAGTVLGNATSASAAPGYTSAPQLGKSGTLGSVTMGNATSGLLTVEPAAGALGVVTVLVPAANDTLANLSGVQTVANKSISGSTNTITNIANASLTNSSITIAGHSVSLGGTQTIACADLSNGATGCSTATGTSGATLPLLNGTNTWSGVQTFNANDLISSVVIGGTTAASSLTMESTSGVGTTDFWRVLTGSQAEAMRITSSGAVALGTTVPTGGSELTSNGSISVLGSGSKVLLTGTTPQIGIGTATPNSSLDASQETDAISLPSGNTGNRPSPATNGMIRYTSSGTPGIEAYINNAWAALSSGGGSGVTSIATTSPITGGTITTTGTIACATCVAASSPGAGIAHFAGATQTVTSSAVSLTADVSGTLPAGNGGTGVTSLGSGVATALGVNTGSAGAMVLFNGAGGTPTSIALTNATGTAASLTAGHVTTNANLTGDVTSVGNATTISSSVALAGSPTTTTQAWSDNSTKIATTANVISHTPVCLTLATDFSVTSSSTFVSVTGMSWTTVAGNNYAVYGQLTTTAASAGGIKVAFQTAGGTIFDTGNMFDLQIFLDSLGSVGLGLFSPLSDTGTTEYLVNVNGNYQAAAGSTTLNLQFAQNTSNATASKVKAGSGICVIQTN